MNCKKIKKLLQLYIDNTLTFGEKQMVEEHLKECPTRRAELEAFSSLKTLKSLYPRISLLFTGFREKKVMSKFLR